MDKDKFIDALKKLSIIGDEKEKNPIIKKLVYQNNKSSKFWNIETNGKNFTVTFGKIGTSGQSQTKEFDSEETCTKEAEKLIKEKLKKGYIEKIIDDEALDELQDKLGFRFSKRFISFCKTNEARSYSERFVNNLPGWTEESDFMLFFQKPGIDLFESMDIDASENKGILPLATLSQYEDEDDILTDFLAVEADKPDCPVLYWNHEVGLFEPFVSSLDDLLKGLIDKSNNDK